jgi:hypothetical protein
VVFFDQGEALSKRAFTDFHENLMMRPRSNAASGKARQSERRLNF